MSQADTIVSGSRKPQLRQHQKLESGGTRPVNPMCVFVPVETCIETFRI